MLFITMSERVVERCNDPGNSNNNRVTNAYRRHIETFKMCEMHIVPRVGETIRLGEGKAYDVIAVVHSTRCCAGMMHPEIFLEVVPHKYEHTHDTGGYSFKEDWPLICDLKSDD